MAVSTRRFPSDFLQTFDEGQMRFGRIGVFVIPKPVEQIVPRVIGAEFRGPVKEFRKYRTIDVTAIFRNPVEYEGGLASETRFQNLL